MNDQKKVYWTIIVILILIIVSMNYSYGKLKKQYNELYEEYKQFQEDSLWVNNEYN